MHNYRAIHSEKANHYKIHFDMRKLLTLAMLVPLLLSCKGEGDQANNVEDVSAKIDTTQLLVANIQKCSKLYAAEVKVHKIVTHADQASLKGSILGQDFNINLPVGERKIAIPIDATLKGYIDFAKFTAEDVFYDEGKVEITLPDPEVALTSSKINHDEISSYVAFFRSNFTDEELARYEHQGRASILKSVPELGIEERTRQSAARTLVPIITQLGFDEQDITITFRKGFTSKSMRVTDDTNKAGK